VTVKEARDALEGILDGIAELPDVSRVFRGQDVGAEAGTYMFAWTVEYEYEKQNPWNPTRKTLHMPVTVRLRAEDLADPDDPDGSLNTLAELIQAAIQTWNTFDRSFRMHIERVEAGFLEDLGEGGMGDLSFSVRALLPST
jgi:hypothetical protein